jgi:hypothetical protein
MNKILYFLMVGFAFTVLQVGTVEAVKDCSDFTPGTPPFESCVAQNLESAGGTPGTAAPMGDPNMAPMTGTPGTAAPMGDPNMAPMTGTPGTAAPMGDAMGDTNAAPSLGERVKEFFGMGTEAPPTGTPGTAAPMGDPNMAPMTGTPGTAAPMGDPNMAPMTGTPGTAAPMGATGTAPVGENHNEKAQEAKCDFKNDPASKACRDARK